MLLSLLVPVMLCSCAANVRYDETFFAMDTVATFTVYEKHDGFSALCLSLLNDSEKELTACGGYMITANEDGQSIEVNQTISELVTKSLYVSGLSDGCYDLTVAPLVTLWNVNGATEPPSEDDINAARGLVGYERIGIDGNMLSFPQKGMGIDLGSVGKGWAGDIIAAGLSENGISSGIVNLGGNIRVFGRNPRSADGKFTIGIKDPFDTSSIIGTVKVTDTNVITSGSYERYFVYEGKVYHHILDPGTGYPADSGLAAVTVICSDGALADMLSTALFVSGEKSGREMLEAVSAEHPDVAAVFVHTDGAVTSFNADTYGAVLK